MKAKMIVVALCGLFVAGCTTEPEYVTRLTQAVNQSIDAQQAANRQTLDALKQAKVVGDDKLAKIDAQVAKLDTVVDLSQQAATEATKAYTDNAAQGKAQAAIEAAQAANRVSAPVNPYSPLIEAVLGVAAVVAGGYGVKTKKDAAVVGKKYKAHKRAYEAEMREATPKDAKRLYARVAEERAKGV